MLVIPVTLMAEPEKTSPEPTWKGSVSLPPDLSDFVEREKGEYGERSKVIQAALRLFRDVRNGAKIISDPDFLHGIAETLEESGNADLQKAAKPVKYTDRKPRPRKKKP